MTPKPQIDWEAPFPEVMQAWIKAHKLNRTEAAKLLHVKLQTLDGWLYAKHGSECPYPETFKLLMQKLFD